mmetsp:Transcript_100059/g.278758  ORF Transcript_100059/g.278758 Transcript_100059/m.278758 type:complete len:182 (+) Transcript_100059:815-1360(+)
MVSARAAAIAAELPPPPQHMGDAPPPVLLLRTVLRLIACDACAALELSAARPQPSTAAQLMAPSVKPWAGLLRRLFVAPACMRTAADAALRGACAGVADTAAGVPAASLRCLECAEVGFLMALRDEVDAMDDADLSAACRRIEPQSPAMLGFIKFLEEEVQDSSEAEGEEEEEEASEGGAC